MMKYRIIYFLIILWSITGCEDLLDVNPKNSLTFKNALETEKDLTAALDGVGRYVRNMANLNYRDQIDKGCYADVVLEDLPSRRLSPEMIDWGYWEQYYSIIAQANIVLHFAAQIEMKDDRKAIYTGQASFYKALAYFDLIRKFGDCMLIKDEVELEPKAKTPWTEVADYAIGLAREAAASLPEFYQMTDYSGKAPRYKSTPCRGAAYAFVHGRPGGSISRQIVIMMKRLCGGKRRRLVIALSFPGHTFWPEPRKKFVLLCCPGIVRKAYTRPCIKTYCMNWVMK